MEGKEKALDRYKRKANNIGKELKEKYGGKLIDKRSIMYSYDLDYQEWQTVMTILKHTGFIEASRTSLRVPRNQ